MQILFSVSAQMMIVNHLILRALLIYGQVNYHVTMSLSSNCLPIELSPSLLHDIDMLHDQPRRGMTLTLRNHMACRFLVTFNYGLFKKMTCCMMFHGHLTFEIYEWVHCYHSTFIYYYLNYYTECYFYSYMQDEDFVHLFDDLLGLVVYACY